MSELLQRAAERVQDNMDSILTNFKPGAKITVFVRTPDKPTADFCMTSDDLDEVIAMVQRRKGDTPSPQTRPAFIPPPPSPGLIPMIEGRSPPLETRLSDETLARLLSIAEDYGDSVGVRLAKEEQNRRALLTQDHAGGKP